MVKITCKNIERVTLEKEALDSKIDFDREIRKWLDINYIIIFKSEDTYILTENN